MDTIKKLTELIEDGIITPPNRFPIKSPCQANFIDAAYDDIGRTAPAPANVADPDGSHPEGNA